MIWIVVAVFVVVGLVVVGALVFAGAAVAGAIGLGAKQFADVTQGIENGRAAFDTLAREHGFRRLPDGVEGDYRGMRVTVRHLSARRGSGSKSYSVRYTDLAVKLPPDLVAEAIPESVLAPARALRQLYARNGTLGCQEAEWALDVPAIGARLDVLVATASSAIGAGRVS